MKRGPMLISEFKFFHHRTQSHIPTVPRVHRFRQDAAVHPWWIRPRSHCSSVKRSAKIRAVQSISLFRPIAILCFASMAFSQAPVRLLLWLYAFAITSDLMDGYLARKLDAVTFFGRVLDLVADKSLTVVSLLYAAKRGIDLLPVAVITTRDVIMLGLRLVRIDGKQILPTNRIFGGSMATILGLNTLVLLYANSNSLRLPNAVYWASAIIFAANLVGRLHASAPQIARALLDDSCLEQTGRLFEQQTPAVMGLPKASEDHQPSDCPQPKAKTAA